MNQKSKYLLIATGFLFCNFISGGNNAAATPTSLIPCASEGQHLRNPSMGPRATGPTACCAGLVTDFSILLAEGKPMPIGGAATCVKPPVVACASEGQHLRNPSMGPHATGPAACCTGLVTDFSILLAEGKPMPIGGAATCVKPPVSCASFGQHLRNPSEGPRATGPTACCAGLVTDYSILLAEKKPIPLGGAATCVPSQAICSAIANKIMSPGGAYNPAHPWKPTPLTTEETSEEPSCRHFYPNLFIPRP